MSLRNGEASWGAAAKTFHWIMALMILIEAPAGLIMSHTFGATEPVKAVWQTFTSHYHHTAGLLLLLVAGLRLVWRLLDPPPAVPPPGHPIERRLARATHAALYLTMVLLPLSGWAALSSLADSQAFGPTHLWLFGIDGFGPGGVIPHIVRPVPYDPHNAPYTYGFFAAWHRRLLWTGAVLLTLHLAAALRHHVLLKDDTLRRMLPGRRSI